MRALVRDTVSGWLAGWMLALLLVLPCAALAEIVLVDLDAPGDDLLKRDTETGLDWLDLSASAVPLGEVGHSVNDILAGVGGWVGRDFRYATGPEVCEFFDHLGLVPDPCPGPLVSGFAIPIMNLIGSSLCCIGQTAYAMGAYDDGGALGLYGRAGYHTSIQAGAGVRVEPGFIDVTESEELTLHSHFLVRTSAGPGMLVPALGVFARGLLIAALVVASIISVGARRTD